MNISIEEKIKIIKSIGEEIIGTDESLLKLLTANNPIIVYDGFEPSNRIHIAQGLMRAHNTNKFTRIGCKFIFLVADVFAKLNNK